MFLLCDGCYDWCVYLGNLPALDSHHVLQVFRNSGITEPQIYHLAAHLRVSCNTVMELKNCMTSLNCEVLATQVIDRWQQQDENSSDLQYAYRKLLAALKSCNLNRVAMQMKMTQRPETILGEQSSNWQVYITQEGQFWHDSFMLYTSWMYMLINVWVYLY